MRRPLLAVAALLVMVVPAAATSTTDAAHTLATHLATTMRKCWFSGDAAFASYGYTPEVNAGAPRILIVAKKAPEGRPLLVVEPTGAKSADAYGPLLASALAPRIRSDLTRWLTGNGACT
jgi:hypothetical protein